jgi:hypothetical protein
MIDNLNNQFNGVKRLFVLDRCTDGSKHKLKSYPDEIFIENNEGEGFLEGKARDLGLSYLGIDNTFFLDGDRIPINFSIDLVNKAFKLYDICLSSVEKDFRKTFIDVFTFNPKFNVMDNDVFTCGLTIRKEMIEKIIKLQNGRLFNSVFDGSFGEEDRFLGSMVYHLGGTCGLFPKHCHLTGDFSKIKNFRKYAEQINKRKNLIEQLFGARKEV